MKPILFSTPMVQAILDGRKTMTRRVIHPQPCTGATRFVKFGAFSGGDFMARFGSETAGAVCDRKPKYKPGDILWVRETWKPQDYQFIDGMWNCAIVYKAGGMEGRVYWPDGTDSIYERCGIWRPSIHMPREAARLFLRVTDVRVEKLQDILCGDMKREGVIPKTVTGGQYQQWQNDYFKPAWDARNAKRGFGWGVNPWVWVITFEQTAEVDVCSPK